MSELIQTRSQQSIRWLLLSTVSALALLAVAQSQTAKAEEDDSPTVWIELGGQAERVSESQQLFAPPFVLQTPRPPAEIVSPLNFERAPRYSKGGETKITVAPHGSDWVASVSLRYGRSNNDKHVHQQSYPEQWDPGHYLYVVNPFAAKFSDIVAHNTEQHLILDFQVGKDVGLGMWGKSTINFGVKFAQFTSKSNITLRSDPDWHFVYKYPTFVDWKVPGGQAYHSYAGHFSASRSFHGIGPSLSWNGSTPVAGSKDETELTFDWGVNAAVLFGRQKTKTHHQTTALYHQASGFYTPTVAQRTVVYQHPATPDHARSRSLVVPNIGGFAGVSFRYVNAKISLGYRADFFFGAMDGGIDARKTYDRNFYGPFATISIGLGG
ncbi:MAG TPA: hypothetical protein VHD95_11800 [Rhizomicrobium sp.]|nr:hypothetical protein [Rhizomicrobium sp.]